MNHEDIQISVMGDVQIGCAVAEISISNNLVAAIYETTNGWFIQPLYTETAPIPFSLFEESIKRAKEKLSIYVNRTGENAPEGFTAAGFSLWLMTKQDGTAMGIKL